MSWPPGDGWLTWRQPDDLRAAASRSSSATFVLVSEVTISWNFEPSQRPWASSSSDSSSLLKATSQIKPSASTTSATSVAAAINFAADCAPRSPSDSFGDLNTCTRANILQQPMVLQCGILPGQSSFFAADGYRAEI